MPDDHLYTYLISLIIFAALSVICALSYYAVHSGVESSVRKAADDGDKRAARLLSAMEKYEKFERDSLFAVILSVIFGGSSAAGTAVTAANMLLPETGTSVLILSAAAGALIASPVFYVLAILLPRSLAEHNPVTAYTFSRLIAVPVMTVLHPIAALSAAITKLLSSPFGVRSDGGDNVTEDEIRDMIDAGEESGSIESTEKEMIENVFDFSDVTASDVMTHRTDMCAIDIDESSEEIDKLIAETGFSRFPVYEDDIDSVTGILYTREYLLNRMSPDPKPLSELIHDPIFTPERVRADVLFREMQKNKIHMAIVLDEYGGTSGLVTMEDLLEEIFGKIYDEFDENEQAEIQPLGDGKWRVAGSVDLETLSETIGIEFDDEVYEDYDTLGGLVFSSLSIIPDDGERPHVEAFGLDIQVEVFADRRVEWATVSVIKDESDEDNEDNKGKDDKDKDSRESKDE